MEKKNKQVRLMFSSMLLKRFQKTGHGIFQMAIINGKGTKFVIIFEFILCCIVVLHVMVKSSFSLVKSMRYFVVWEIIPSSFSIIRW
jgi:hypothetical protein